MSAPAGKEEWFVVRGWSPKDPQGLIPRSVCESLGVNCRPADQEPQGTIWFTKEQSEAIRKHPRWEPAS